MATATGIEEDGRAGDGVETWRELNRANWDERVAVHLASDFYRVEQFVAGEDPLHGFEDGELGPLAGTAAIHLQCHLGLDTLALGRRGAEVTGLDFSRPALEAARRLADRTGVAARFVEADVYDAPAALGRRYDLVYTGKGALNWLPDIGRWAEVVASLLCPGGRLYLVEFHPFVSIFGDESLSLEYPYFDEGPVHLDDPGDYADPDARLSATRTVQFAHPLGEIVTALVEAGLVLEFLHELTECSFRRFPFLVESQPGLYAMPPGMVRLPMMFSLRARRPA